MRESKFTMNALVLVVIIFSALTFFFTIRLVDLANLFATNQFFPVENSNVAIRYSNLYPNGIYEGDRINGVLKLEGNFGVDWGAIAQGDRLYVNEYTGTTFGLMLCQMVEVDLNTYEKTEVRRDTMLRGRCASGELVCVEGFLMPSDHPKTNALCRLYALASRDIRPEGDSAVVLFLDPATGEVVYSVRDEQALADGFEARYLERTLEEVRG